MNINVELLNGLKELIVALNGNSAAVIIIIGILIVALIIRILDFYTHKISYDRLERILNDQIERLAEDNHLYRTTYLLSIGMNEERLKEITAMSVMKKGE